MHLSLTPNNLAAYIQKQLSNIFPDDGDVSKVSEFLPASLERIEFCFKHISTKYFRLNGESLFNHLHGDQYSMLLYILSNEIYNSLGDTPICDKLFGLNKVMHGIDCFYSVELPPIFLFCHPLGSILGKAQYSDYLFVSQNCTVGSNHYVDYPIVGRNVALYKNASILGNSHVGNNCKIAADSTVMDQDIPAGSIYIGNKSSYVIKKFTKSDVVWDPEFLVL